MTKEARDLISRTIRLPFQNAQGFLQITGLIWLLQLPAFISGNAFDYRDALVYMGLPPGPLTVGLAVISALAVFLGTAWAAVGWHRLMILNEQPDMCTARLYPAVTVRYFVVSIIIPLIGWLPPILIFAALEAAGESVSVLLRYAVAFPLGWLSCWLVLRLSPTLVGSAVGNNLSLQQAWRQTGAIAKPLVHLALAGWIMFAAMFLTDLILGVFLSDHQGYYISTSAAVLWVLYSMPTYLLMFAMCVSAFNVVYDRTTAAGDTANPER